MQIIIYGNIKVRVKVSSVHSSVFFMIMFSRKIQWRGLYDSCHTFLWNTKFQNALGCVILNLDTYIQQTMPHIYQFRVSQYIVSFSSHVYGSYINEDLMKTVISLFSEKWKQELNMKYMGSFSKLSQHTT